MIGGGPNAPRGRTIQVNAGRPPSYRVGQPRRSGNRHYRCQRAPVAAVTAARRPGSRPSRSTSIGTGSRRAPAAPPHRAATSAGRLPAQDRGGLDGRTDRHQLGRVGHQDGRPVSRPTTDRHVRAARTAAHEHQRQRRVEPADRRRRSHRMRRAARPPLPRRRPSGSAGASSCGASPRSCRWPSAGSASARRRGRAAPRPHRPGATSSRSRPSQPATRSTAWVQLSVAASGRYRPVASANPATIPLGSAAGRVRRRRRSCPTSRGSSPPARPPDPSPSAAAMLSPVPGRDDASPAPPQLRSGRAVVTVSGRLPRPEDHGEELGRQLDLGRPEDLVEVAARRGRPPARPRRVAAIGRRRGRSVAR